MPMIVACIENIWQTLVGALNVTFQGARQLRTQIKRLMELQLNNCVFSNCSNVFKDIQEL